MKEKVVIDASQSGIRIPVRDLWNHRELAMLLVRRHVLSRYAQMALGALWAVLEPLAQLLMLTAVFGAILRVDTGGLPYPVFAFAGLIPWFLFSKTTNAVAGCLLENMNLISKVYFPRLILPLASVARELIDGFVTLVLLVALAAAFGFFPQPKLLLAPVILFVTALAACGLGMWVAALMVRFRDVRPALSVVLQAGMYLTPILYPPSLVPERFLQIYQLNPMYWAVQSFRWLLLDQPFELEPTFYFSMGLVGFLFVSGVIVFTIFEKMTVDVQ